MPDPGAEVFCRRSAYRFILQLQIEESLFQGKMTEITGTVSRARHRLLDSRLKAPRSSRTRGARRGYYRLPLAFANSARVACNLAKITGVMRFMSVQHKAGS
jgi:hypothetical protein